MTNKRYYLSNGNSLLDNSLRADYTKGRNLCRMERIQCPFAIDSGKNGEEFAEYELFDHNL